MYISNIFIYQHFSAESWNLMEKNIDRKKKSDLKDVLNFFHMHEK
jgi:hypothetical protein